MERWKSMKRTILFGLAIILVLSALSLPAAGQDQFKMPELKTELVRLKYVTPHEIEPLLRPYLTNPWGRISSGPGNDKLLVINDTPENLPRILAVIKEVDAKPADILFTVQLVLGSETGEGKTDEALQNDQVIGELKKLLKYKSFSLLDQNFVRTLDQKDAEILIGKNPEFTIAFRRPKFIKDGNFNLIQTEVRLVRLERGLVKDASQGTPSPTSSTEIVQTALTIKSGEKTVVGVSKLDGGDKALILIILAKAIE
jgi:hypothetical protein